MGNPKKTLYLHVGMPKCATTTVQAGLIQNAATLESQGIFYDVHPQDTTNGQGNAAQLAAGLMEKREDKVSQLLDYFLRRDGDVVLSSEILIGVARSQNVARFLENVAQRGFAIQIICYLRRQDFWIESDYKQHIKGASPWVDDIHALLKMRSEKRTLDYYWLLQNWARYVGANNVHVVPLDPKQDAGFAMESFWSLVGARGTTAPTGRRNASPPAGLIEPARFIKKELMSRGCLEQRIPARIAAFLAEAPALIDVPPRKFLLSYELRKNLVERYAASNRALSETFLAGQQAFAEDVLPDPDNTPPLSEEAAATLAAYALSISRTPTPSSRSRTGRLLRRWTGVSA